MKRSASGGIAVAGVFALLLAMPVYSQAPSRAGSAEPDAAAASEDGREGMAAFREKRAARFAGR